VGRTFLSVAVDFILAFGFADVARAPPPAKWAAEKSLDTPFM